MKIGRYTVCGLLGRGGMGAVYKVRQPVTGRIAALKLLRPAEILEELVGLPTLADTFATEARTMASLDHPNIAAVWDYDEADGKPFFVMEYYCLNLGMLIGESYRVEAPTRRLPMHSAVSYARQTLDALARMHHAGVIHRDVKPFNIMVTGHDEVKLIDFGLSRLRGETPVQHSGGVRIGSPYYAAPEQEEDPESVDGRADLYPVGVMLYRMLTGVLPNDEEVMDGGAIPDASNYTEDCDHEWDAFFRRAIADDPDERFPDAAAMASALDKLYSRWESRVANVCSLTEPDASSPRCAPRTHPLRAEPVKVGTADAQETFSLDELWRPCCITSPELEEQVVTTDGKTVKTVLDAAAGRMWQQSGSEYPMTWQEAHEYVDMLNAYNHAGYNDWRLPTVDELCTLVRDTPMLGDFCLPSVFDDAKGILWTCDRKSYMAAWFVSAAMGFTGWQDFTCRFSVRAVRTT